ncbi:MAG: hypothetical protein AB1411_01610 [Nitrospirota bacterium]
MGQDDPLTPVELEMRKKQRWRRLAVLALVLVAAYLFRQNGFC